MGQERGGVSGHVLQPVGRRRAVAHEQGPEIRRALELGREADVTVVVADSEEAAAGEVLHELLGPGDELGPQAHDQQQRRIGGIAPGLELDIDPIDVCGGHGGSLAGDDGSGATS